mmetsp:Transcript_22135/g.89648  ORF Transcript_22135/g.89648 Transcript_22135/m.89648 type:complete len:183 (-) Transcript_22135:199-747(-)
MRRPLCNSLEESECRFCSQSRSWSRHPRELETQSQMQLSSVMTYNHESPQIKSTFVHPRSPKTCLRSFRSTFLGGDFVVPSYRTGLFLDPKGRGGVTGYDMAVALPAREADGAEGQDELFKETNKVFDVTDGSIEMAVNKIDPETKEIAGVFVSEQLSDTDMGAKAPKKILLKGVFYGRIED